MKFSIVKVTPEEATRLLRTNTNNRNVTEARVEQYARDMAEGRWRQTGDTLKFASDGTLMDGQHRLMAVVKSGLTVELAVVHGLDRNSFDGMDKGKARTPGDDLTVDGVKRYARSIASMGRMVVAERRGLLNPESVQLVPGNQTVTSREIRDFVESQPDVMDIAQDVMSRFRAINAFLPPAISMFVLWKARQDHPETAERYFQGLATGTGLEAGSPVLATRERLLREGRAGKSHRGRQYLVLMNGYLSFREGKQLFKMQAAGKHSGAKQAARFTRNTVRAQS